jgi:hypothetical protein
MPREGDESELRKYIKKLEARIEALEKAAEERMHKVSDKWFKRSLPEKHVPGELRMVLMGPPGAGSRSIELPLIFREGDTVTAD